MYLSPADALSVKFLDGHRPKPKAQPKPETKPKNGDRVLALSVTITLVLLVTIGVPLGAILPERYVKKLPINVIVPLYMSPDEGGWEPLFEAAIRHNDLNFTAIINPAHGPSTPPLPAPQYITQVSRLNSSPNINTLGYINITSGTRSNTTIRDDIAVYEGWARHQGLSLGGIFFDQVPNSYDESGAGNETREYLTNISATVKHSANFTGSRTVMLNVGAVPVMNLTSIPFVDITIAFQGAFGDMPDYVELKKALAGIPGGRENFGCMVHSVPSDISKPGLRRLINGVRRPLQYLYVTDVADDWYQGLGTLWLDFLSLTW